MENGNIASEVFVGTVIFFKATRGYGFISWSDEHGNPKKDIFVHYSDIVMSGYRVLKKDQKVSFSVGTNHNGDPKAINVTPIDD